jgi:hypothetical protein
VRSRPTSLDAPMAGAVAGSGRADPVSTMSRG